MAEQGRSDRDPDYSQGLEDHHDPTGRLTGAPPARSALTLRLVLASFGLVVTGVMAVLSYLAGLPVVIWGVLAVLAVVAAVDIVVILRRKARGEPG